MVISHRFPHKTLTLLLFAMVLHEAHDYLGVLTIAAIVLRL